MSVDRFVCNSCGKSFGSEDSLNFHVRDRHTLKKSVKKVKVEEKRVKKSFSFKWSNNYFLVLFLLGFVALFGLSLLKQRNVTESVAGMPSGPIHYHVNLTIIVNGEQVLIPNNLGVRPGGHLPVHTHEDGLVHWEVARPTVKNMRLGYFFDVVWGKKFSKDCVLDFCGGNLTFFVNGVRNYDFDDYIIKDGDQLLIIYNE